MISSEIKRNGKQANVSIFAFTATPKPTIIQLFGRLNKYGQREAFHVYSMKQAIEEGFILDVLQNYTEYSTFYQLNKEIEDDPRCKINAAKRQIARFVGLHETNIAQRVEVIVEHFRTTVMQELSGQAKAMVITASRQGAVKYRQAFEEYITKKGYDGIRALVAFSGKVKLPDDDKEYTEVSINGFSEDRLVKEFDTDNYQVLLVANKYQTGFDQPKLCAMYVLKKLRGVNAVQTLSRLNRICASQFIQKKGEEHISSDLVAKPVMKLPTAEHFGLTEDKEKRLSEIIDEINSRTGKNYDNDVVVKAMLRIRDILMKSDKLKTSAKNNTQQDFEFSYFDDIDDALIEGLSQNQDFFSMLLSNDEMKRQVLGIFSGEIYKNLRESL